MLKVPASHILDASRKLNTGNRPKNNIYNLKTIKCMRTENVHKKRFLTYPGFVYRQDGVNELSFSECKYNENQNL